MKRLEQLELVLAVIVTVLAFALHWQCATHMGPLWRDEITSVDVASLPTFNEIWNNLQYDSYPMFWHCTLRTWIKLGLGSDTGLRLFGFLVGMGIVGMLWINARIFKHASPLIALILLELNPTIFYWGDTIRGQGLSLLLSTGIPGVVWLLLKKPSYKSFFIALGVCGFAVHTQLYNAVLLFATGVTAMALGCVWRQYRSIALIAGMGALCAVSLLPYSTWIQQTGVWVKVELLPEFTFSWFLARLSEAIGSLWGMADVCIWAALFLAGAVTVVIGFKRHSKKTGRDDAGIFFLIGGVICFTGYFAFLKHLSYITYTWHYIPLMGFSALAVEGMLGSSRQKTFVIARLVVGTALVCLWFPWAWENAGERVTDIDLIANKIESTEKSGDFIIVNSWEEGISFQRYYKGDNAWMTVPPMPVPKFHRYDQMMISMILPDPTRAVDPILSNIASALRAGKQVWLVGGEQFLPDGVKPFALPTAPYSRFGWMNSAYYSMWSEDIGYFIQSHATNANVVNIPVDGKVNQYEALPLIVVSGWHD